MVESNLKQMTVFIKQFVDSLEQNICCNKTSFHPINSSTSSGLRENRISALIFSLRPDEVQLLVG